MATRQNGYYDQQGHPRDNLIAAVTNINRVVYTHTPNPATPADLFRKLFEKYPERYARYTAFDLPDFDPPEYAQPIGASLGPGAGAPVSKHRPFRDIPLATLPIRESLCLRWQLPDQ